MVIVKKRQYRRAGGQSLAELCTGLIVCVPLLLSAIDMSYIALGASINDNVCRDAARAAASGEPQMQNPARHAVNTGQPYDRAVAIIKTHNPTCLPIKVDDRPEVFETVRDIPPRTMGGAVDGEVEVKTKVLIVPPFVLRAFVPGGVKLTAVHSIPYTFSVRQSIKP